MAVIRRFGITPELDMEQILREAQHRWLRPAEICEILRNYRNFHIAPEPPNRPHSGLLFLFDRKVLRYFRKDGHNWRKKKDGKTVKEAHERLKVGSVDVLHCYYAHGEDNENFQRRSYWLLEEDLMHIVLVHYREVQSTKAGSSRNRDSEEISQSTETGTPLSSNSVSKPKSMRSKMTDVESLGSVHVSEYEDPEPDNHHAVSRYHPCPEHEDPEKPVRDSSNLNAYFPVPSSITDEFSSGSKICDGPGPGVHFDFLEDCMTESSRLADDLNSVVMDSCKIDVSCQTPLIYEFGRDVLKVGGSSKHTLFKQISMEISNTQDDCRLRKCDSFCKWMSKELEEVNDPHIQLSSPHNWIQVETENLAGDSENIDMYLLSPAVSQDQLFSIVDFSPQWGYAGIETKVLVMGSFLKDMVDVGKCDWSCMFGEIEVPAQVIADGVLRCHAPVHKPGLVHFYVTCSNRLACSEIREFEYMEIPDSCCGSESEYLFHLRLMKLLSIGYDQIQLSASYLSSTKLHLSNKVNSLLRDEDNDWSTILNPEDASCLLLERLLKQKLRDWLLCKIAEDGKGASVLDEEGQGVLHLASALGYDWAIAPTVSAGVSVDFRDTRGWTALHWAASCGRERTVVALFSLDAAPGALTDPTLEFPSGRTPADLASINGHKGIAGFLAESSLTKHLAILTLKDLGAGNTAASTSSIEAFIDVERTATRAIDQNMDVGLCAIRKAALAAARIHQVFRVESFQRKKLSDLARDDEEYALPIVPSKSKKSGQSDGSLAAVIRIQNKFRGWKGRKEFLITRQRIIKIQAHVRGHLVRKHNANNILWSVGIVEKIILRWRRKGNGLRGFRSQALTDRPGPHGQTSQQDDFDFLKEGRKQAEVKTDQALARVNSMVQHPEARDQYRRLLNVLEELQESKELLERNDLHASEGKMMFDDPLIN